MSQNFGLALAGVQPIWMHRGLSSFQSILHTPMQSIIKHCLRHHQEAGMLAKGLSQAEFK